MQLAKMGREYLFSQVAGVFSKQNSTSSWKATVSSFPYIVFVIVWLAVVYLAAP